MLLKIIAVLLLLILTLFTCSYLRHKYIEARQKKDFLKIFGEWKSSLPTLAFGSHYGWTTFEVIFEI